MDRREFGARAVGGFGLAAAFPSIGDPPSELQNFKAGMRAIDEDGWHYIYGRTSSGLWEWVSIDEQPITIKNPMKT